MRQGCLIAYKLQLQTPWDAICRKKVTLNRVRSNWRINMQWLLIYPILEITLISKLETNRGICVKEVPH